MTAAIAIAVFAAAYILIATEKLNRALASLGGAAILLALGVVGAHDAFYAEDTAVDWNVIFLLLGMMIIVSVLRHTGVFEYLAIWAVKRARGQPLRVMVLLVLITAGASAMLDNVTTVLLVAPVTLLVCERLAVNPVPFLIAEAMASNIGGTATLIGDPPNIIIASRSGLTFNDFLVNLAPLIVIVLAVFIAMLAWLFRGSFTTTPERIAEAMQLEEREAIEDGRLLTRSLIVLALVFAGFVSHHVTHIEPSVIALLGAGLLIVVTSLDTRGYVADIEWQTLLFFAGLFVMVGALVKVGVIGGLANLIAEATGGELLLATTLMLFASAVLSGVVDNIPYVAAMAPVVSELIAGNPSWGNGQVLWWSLAIGADLGGNATAIGASANVVILGIAARSQYPISFWQFTKYGLVVTAVTVALAFPYLYLRYFLLA